MEIMPSTSIKFLRNIPFDNDYNDTIYFHNPTAQHNYFNGFVKYHLTNQYYTRHSAGVINVQLPNLTKDENGWQISTAESLYDCNYMMFDNANYRYVDPDDGLTKQKVFYAFITDVEYVNNEVARVTFEIDVMQTWMFDYVMEQCFIEREHSLTDIAGENIVDENIETGDTYLTHDLQDKTADFTEMSAYVLYSRNPDGSFISTTLVSNIPTSLGVRSFPIANATDLSAFGDFLEKFLYETGVNTTPDDIISIYLYPTQHYGTLPTINGSGLNNGDVVEITRPSTFKYISPSKYNDSYSPRNKKLYTYPYMGIEVSNHEGTSQMYHFEYFRPKPIADTNSQKYQFVILGAEAPSPALILVPANYLPTQPYSHNSNLPTPPYTPNLYNEDAYDYGVAITDFQQCAWVGDAFKAWWAQNKNSFVASTSSSIGAGVAQLVAGGITHNPYLIGMGAVGAIGGVASSMAKIEDTKHKTPIVGGLSNTISLPIAKDYFGFTVRTKTITGEQAKIIDQYMGMFGYATHRVKTPNVANKTTFPRERWCYTQTVGCTIKGRLPSAYQKQICKIYDKGIRFWDTYDWNGHAIEIGEYLDPNTGELYPNLCTAERPTPTQGG